MSSALEKRQQIIRWHQQMKAAYERHDKKAAVLWAKKILQAEPRNRPVMEQIAMLFIDENMQAEARACVEILGRYFPETGTQLFLRSRAAELEGQYDACCKLAEAALQKNDMEPWRTSMTHNILGHVYRKLGEIKKSAQHYYSSSIMRGSSAVGDDSLAIQDYSNYLFTLHNIDLPREEMFAAIKKYNDFFVNIPQYQHKREARHKKLRIGYISPDLRFHVVAFFSYALLKSYDKIAFEVYAYAACAEDNASREFADSVDVWRNIQFLSPQQAAAQIYQDEIDILVDLSGHTAGNCLPVLAYKPAPVQISGIGWFNSTGLKTVDYFLADYYTDPVGMNDEFFTEKLLRLPHSHFCYMWHDAPLPPSPAPYRQNGFVTFGSFNNFSKVTDEMLALWSQILARVPHSRLFLKAGIFNTEDGTRRALARLEKAGIDRSRVLIGRLEKDYLKEYGKLDIALDTFPYPGGGTTCDALYMGVPVITLVGRRHNARFGYSLLMNMNLAELCAENEQEYIEKAVALAGQPERITEYHQTLRRRMRESPVMDDGMYMAELECLYQAVWQNWLAGRDNVVPAIDRKRQSELAGQMAEAYIYKKEIRYQKRAAYWLARAEGGNPQEIMERYGLLSEAREAILDYYGAWQAADAAVKSVPEDSKGDSAVLESIYAHHAKLSLQAGKAAEAFDSYAKAWQAAPAGKNKLAMYSSLLLAAHYLPFSSADMMVLHREYGKMFADVKPFLPRRAEGKKKLHIAYLSADFRQHVMFSIYFGMLACHDRKAFTITCYSLNPEKDAFTEMVKKYAERFVNLAGMDYAAAAQRIYADAVDILIDLGGHSTDSGLPILAWRPARVQISGLGYLNMTGLPAVGYFITDEWTDPAGVHDEYFTEQFLYLPSQFCYTGRNDVKESAGAPCRKNGRVLFGVFNHYAKITDEMLQCWKLILEKVPDSELLLKSQELVSDSLVDAAYARMKQIGFDMDRVHFEPAALDYMERYLNVDIALDTYPYTGGGTTFDALYMGVPVITQYGERRNTRFGLSILQNIGLGELASASSEAYVAKAVSLAADKDLLDALHKQLRGMLQKSIAGNPAAYTKAWERQLWTVWQKAVQNDGN